MKIQINLPHFPSLKLLVHTIMSTENPCFPPEGFVKFTYS